MPAEQEHQHTIFISPERALQVARQDNLIIHANPNNLVPQLCYCVLPPSVSNVPSNFHYVPTDELVAFLSTTRLFWPTIIDSSDPEKNLDNKTKTTILHYISESLKEVWRQTHENIRELKEQLAQLDPWASYSGPLRVFACTRRSTTVLQYSLKGLLKGFSEMGCETLLLIEATEQENLLHHHLLQTAVDFAPHIVLMINNPKEEYYHPSVFQVSWWQDYTPSLRQPEQALWPLRSLPFSIAQIFDPPLKKIGCKNLQRQPFCIDTDVFRLRPSIKRKNKIVFIGSSYSIKMSHGIEDERIFSLLIPAFLKGEPITTAFLHEISQELSVRFDYIFWNAFHHLVRQLTVQWICQQSTLPVEIYGRFWEDDPIVAPFYLGPIEHGSKVAEVYNGAKYALVSHPFEIMSQRLAEAGACGAIPIVYDCRWSATKPHWEEECLLYKTREELLACLTTDHQTYPERFTEYFSFEHFAARILDMVRDEASLPPQ